jgi:hypothetical protein
MFHHHNLVIFKLPRTPLLFIKHLIESLLCLVFGRLFEIGPDNELGQLSLGRVLGFITMVLKKTKDPVLVYDHSSQTLNPKPFKITISSLPII